MQIAGIAAKATFTIKNTSDQNGIWTSTSFTGAGVAAASCLSARARFSRASLTAAFAPASPTATADGGAFVLGGGGAACEASL